MSTNITYFDIETGPESEEWLAEMMPEFEAPKNLKDPEKIAAAVAEKRRAWLDDAALSPLTGRILAIGYKDADGTTIVHDRDESKIIADFMERLGQCVMGSHGIMVGFNIHDFDLPFIFRRALLHGIAMPSWAPPPGGRRFAWPSWLVDLREAWGFGEYQPKGSLDVICRFLGLGSKSGSGADFARLYENPGTRQQALDYLANDLRLTEALSKRLGVG